MTEDNYVLNKISFHIIMLEIMSFGILCHSKIYIIFICVACHLYGLPVAASDIQWSNGAKMFNILLLTVGNSCTESMYS